jgi:NAD-dependent SIR2 family protein deacetylase
MLLAGNSLHEFAIYSSILPKMKTVIFLGAGASAADGAPEQATLFKDYFLHVRGEPVRHVMEGELAAFFKLLFGIDVDDDNLDSVTFPTFEEALGIVDLAERRHESFKDFDLENMASNSNRIGFLRQYLVMLMVKIIDAKLQTANGIHIRLINNLKRANLLKDTSFVTTNYDILVDNALAALDQAHPYSGINYGMEFEGSIGRPTAPIANAPKLFKLHGSLNWLYCPTCATMTLTPGEKGVIRLIDNFPGAICPRCESIFVPVIVPPTYFKDMSNVFLNTVWNKCDRTIADANHIVFCGYSFPDADMHIKYLIKRIQTNRRHLTSQIRFTVINNKTGKLGFDKNQEKIRFKRFLGTVNYTEVSFEQFADNPQNYY